MPEQRRALRGVWLEIPPSGSPWQGCPSATEAILSTSLHRWQIQRDEDKEPESIDRWSSLIMYGTWSSIPSQVGPVQAPLMASCKERVSQIHRAIRSRYKYISQGMFCLPSWHSPNAKTRTDNLYQRRVQPAEGAASNCNAFFAIVQISDHKLN